MTYLLIGLLASLALNAAFLVAMLKERDAMARILTDFSKAAEDERTRLVAAIQRPDLPVRTPAQPVRRSPEDITRDRERAREMASVGTVAHKAD